MQATPAKRLFWHLAHFRLKTAHCLFAGAPLPAAGAGRVPEADSGTGSAARDADSLGAGAVGNGEVGKLVKWTFAAANVVLALDVKGSLASLSLAAGPGQWDSKSALLLDVVFATAVRYIQSLAHGLSAAGGGGGGEGQHVHMTVIAQGSTTSDLRIVAHDLLLSGDNVDSVLQAVSAEFEYLRAQFVNGTWCSRTDAGGGLDAAAQDEPRADLQHLLMTCLRMLDLLPAHGCPSISLITDGVVTIYYRYLYIHI